MWVIGDVHGKIEAYLRALKVLPADAKTIQLGDMGIGFRGVFLPHSEGQHRFIRGNHDNPQMCQRHPDYLGEYGYLKDEGIFYVGGAYSIDRDMRIEGRDWWPDEELSVQQLTDAIALYERVKPRVVVSHECPRKVNRYILERMLVDGLTWSAKALPTRTCDALESMLRIWQPEHWFFGHYHVSKVMYVAGIRTRFECVPELGCVEVPVRFPDWNCGSGDHACQLRGYCVNEECDQFSGRIPWSG